jgi:hypothetical protein
MSDGGFVICGYQEPNHHSRILIIRTDDTGNKLWEKTIGQSGAQSARSIRQTQDGGFVMTGWIDTSSVTRQDLFLIKLEPEISPIVQDKLAAFPSSNSLFQNYPNPFNPITTIEFDLPKSSELTLKIFNILGEEVATLLSASLLSGSHSVQWDASNLASAVYLYRLQAGDYVETRKMVLMR